ncbi:MAG: MTAP family purine nucleoside phosphorylase [Chthonomonadales bacterium]
MSGIAIIGGTGFETLAGDLEITRIDVGTCFGPIIVNRASRASTEFYFLSRHGADHHIAPHSVPYQANIAALVELGVSHVIGTNAVGSLSIDLEPGSFVLYDDFIDFTRNRPLTYWTGHPSKSKLVVHTDFSNPYCDAIRKALLEWSAISGVNLVKSATYVCTDGPRFESPAEIRMFRAMGGDVVGMTGLPEAIFAREAGLHYAGIGIVSNLGAGLSDGPVDHEANNVEMITHAAILQTLLLHAVEAIILDVPCRCFPAH